MDAAKITASSTMIFPEPEDKDFDEEIGEEEKKFYITKYKDSSKLKSTKFHCTACDKHLGCLPKSEGRIKSHPMLKTLVCRPCHTFYNSGEFEHGDDGSELYCRWCGQGGQVYCCSICPIVFCAKCIRRNLGQSMIREIESTDDWKCFRCAPKVLWDLRADCWALLRYCDFKNKQAHMTTDSELKEKLLKECAIDDSDCCKSKKRTFTHVKKKETKEEVKDSEDEKAKALAKIPSGIKVKKFAAISSDAILKSTLEKKGVKRPLSPPKLKPIGSIRAPIPIAPYPKPLNMPNPMTSLRPISTPPQAKKPRYQSTPVFHQYSPYRYRAPRAPVPVPIRTAQTAFPVPAFNGYNNFVHTDNINLSLESLTQGLDMSAVSNLSNTTEENNDELVCTPDFPLEPLCEVTEDTADDDVECITPGPVAAPKPALQPQRTIRTLPEISPDNIVQMTDADVTVNAVTGGLKFRVDPQTLSANKMYRLPDGRIFAINANPNMPGGYSATIVAVSETVPVNNNSSPRGTAFPANITTVSNPATVSSGTSRSNKKTNKKSDKPKPVDRPKSNRPVRECVEKNRKMANRTPDMNTSVEWYRYHILDSIDALQYSLERLERLKKQADTQFLRTRTVEEMKTLHSQLERHLRTSYSRFHEIRDNLNKGFKSYLREKGSKEPQNIDDEDDDDDVEILNDPEKDDPIFIDENSVDTSSENDVTAVSSEYNDSTETQQQNIDPLEISETQDNEKKSTENSKKDECGIESQSKNTVEESTDEKTNADSDPKTADGTISVAEVNDNVELENNELITSDTSKNEDQSEDYSKEIVSNEKGGEDAENNKSDEAEETYGDKGQENEKFEKREQSQGVMEHGETEQESKTATNNEANATDNDKRQEKDKIESSLDESEHDFKEQEMETDSAETNKVSEEITETECAENRENKDGDQVNGDKPQAMEVDTNGDVNKEDADIQMSDEMIDNLLADDGPHEELSEELQKLTERSLDSLAETDLISS